MKDYSTALLYAESKHKGQFRIGGEPYITHPIAVAQLIRDNGYDETYQITALFHDLLEDTDATEAEIFDIGGGAVLTAVRLLTKTSGYVMSEYVANIKANPIAYAVKTADRLHNLRSAVVADDSFKQRYILETVDWYLDFSVDILRAAKELAASMTVPIKDLPFTYEPADDLIIRRE